MKILTGISLALLISVLFVNCIYEKKEEIFVKERKDKKEDQFLESKILFGWDNNGHFLDDIKTANGKIYGMTNGLFSIYNKFGKLENQCESFSFNLGTEYSDFTKNYYISSFGGIFEYNPETRVNHKIISNDTISDIRDIKVDGKLVFLEQTFYTTIYNLETKMIVSIIKNDVYLGKKRIDKAKNIFLGYDQGRQSIVKYNYNKTDSSLVANFINLENKIEYFHLSKNGKFIYGYISDWDNDSDSFVIVDVNNGKLIKKIKSYDSHKEIGDNILLFNDDDILFLNTSNFDQEIHLEISENINYLLTENGEKYLLKNDSLFFCDDYFSPEKFHGKFSKINDIIEYLNLYDELFLYCIEESCDYHNPSFFIDRKLEKLIKLNYSIKLEFKKDEIKLESRKEYKYNPLLYQKKIIHEYKRFYLYARNSMELLLVQKEPSGLDSSHLCKFINEENNTLKKFKISNKVYEKLPEFGSISYSKNYEYISSYGNRVVFNRMNMGHFEYMGAREVNFDLENELMYTVYRNKIFYYDLKNGVKSDSITFNKFITSFKIHEGKRFALIQIFHYINLLYDLKNKEILCSIKFIKGTDSDKAGIIIQDKENNYYCSGYVNQMNLLKSTNKHVNFLPTENYLRLLKKEYGISINKDLLSYNN